VSVHDHMSVGRAPNLGRDGVSGTSYNDGWLLGNGGEWTKIEGGRWEEKRREEQRNRKDVGVIAALVSLSLLWHTSVHQEGSVLQRRASGGESGGKGWTSKGAVQPREVEGKYEWAREWDRKGDRWEGNGRAMKVRNGRARQREQEETRGVCHTLSQ